MTALTVGARAVRANPRLVLGLWLVSIAAALPLTLAVRSSIAESIGPSLVHESLQNGLDLAWHGEYAATAKGFEHSVRPSIAGGGAFLDNAEAWLTGKLFEEDPLLVGAGVLYALVWTFLLGGVLDRLARPAAERAPGSFARACGVHFPRFLALAVVSGVLYLGVYRLAGWIMRWLDGWTRDVTSEREVLALTAGAWCVVALLLVVVHVWFALSRIALATGRSTSVPGAVGRGLGLLVSRPLRTLGVYVLYATLGAALVGLYVGVAPTAGPASAVAVLLAFGLGQALIVAKTALRVGVLAELAHSSR